MYRTYWIAWGVLLALDGDDGGPRPAPLPRGAFVVLILSAMLVKATSLRAYFMHLRFERWPARARHRDWAAHQRGDPLRPDRAGCASHLRHAEAAVSRSSGPYSGRVALLIAVVLIAAETGVLQAQCSMCRTLLATPEGERIAAALRSGIWILLAAPFGAFAVIALAAIRSRRRYLSGGG